MVVFSTLGEPEGILDHYHRNKLQNLLPGLSQSLIVATCDMDLAQALAERAVLVDEDCIVADGSVGQIMSDHKLMTKHNLEVPHGLR